MTLELDFVDVELGIVVVLPVIVFMGYMFHNGIAVYFCFMMCRARIHTSGKSYKACHYCAF